MLRSAYYLVSFRSHFARLWTGARYACSRPASCESPTGRRGVRERARGSPRSLKAAGGMRVGDQTRSSWRSATAYIETIYWAHSTR